MEEILVQLVLAACVVKQQELAALQAAAMIHHGYSEDRADEFHEYGDRKYQNIKIGTAALFGFLDDCIINIMVHYDLPPLDDHDVVEISGMYLMANHPAVAILMQESEAFAQNHVLSKSFQSIH